MNMYDVWGIFLCIIAIMVLHFLMIKCMFDAVIAIIEDKKEVKNLMLKICNIIEKQDYLENTVRKKYTEDKVSKIIKAGGKHGE